jgi:hypothetical protein
MAMSQEFPRTWDPSGAANLWSLGQNFRIFRKDSFHLAGSAKAVFNSGSIRTVIVASDILPSTRE